MNPAQPIQGKIYFKRDCLFIVRLGIYVQNDRKSGLDASIHTFFRFLLYQKKIGTRNV